MKDAEAGSRVALLLERPRTGRPGDITSEQAETLEALLWHHGPHLTARHAHRVLVARHAPGDVPGIATVKRRLKAWREDNAAGLSAVLSPDRHRSLRMPAFGTAGTAMRADGLNVLWEIDSTLCDVICSDGRRRALIAVIDVWSRRALFLVSRTSRASAIAALLRRAILLWGVPQMLVTDEGKDYVKMNCRPTIHHYPPGTSKWNRISDHHAARGGPGTPPWTEQFEQRQKQVEAAQGDRPRRGYTVP